MCHSIKNVTRVLVRHGKEASGFGLMGGIIIKVNKLIANYKGEISADG